MIKYTSGKKEKYQNPKIVHRIDIFLLDFKWYYLVIIKIKNTANRR